VNKTILNIKEGKGAELSLSNDPGLVSKIDSTMINVNEASSRLNDNLEVFKTQLSVSRILQKRKKKLREQEK
jgi:phospholipid/cholesterol/gamma-HCH transport system substrate-binding protein